MIALLAAAALFVVLARLTLGALHSEPAQRLARAWLVRAAAAAGVELEVAAVRWELLPPGLVLERCRLDGAGVEVEVRRLEVSLANLRLARRTLEFDAVAADGVRIRSTGLPRRSGADRPRLLRLAVRQLDLRDVTLDGRRLADRVDLLVTGLDASFVDREGPPRGFVSARGIRLSGRGFEPVELRLRARVVVDEGIELPRIAIDASGARVEGVASLARDGRLTARLAGRVDLAELDRVLRARASLAGTVEFEADLDSAADPPVSVQVRGAHVAAAGFSVDDLQGRLELGRHGLVGALERATFHGGEVSGGYRLTPLGPPYHHQVEVSGRGVAVAGILSDLKVPAAGLAGSSQLEVDLDWDGREVGGGRGRGAAVLTPTSGPLPVAGRLSVELLAEGLLRFHSEDLRIGGSEVRWEGPLVVGAWEPAWAVRAEPAVLEELAPLVNAWVGQEVLPADLVGAGSLAVSLTGPWRELVVSILLDARPLAFAGLELDHVVAEGLISGSRLSLGPVHYRLDDGHGEVGGSVDWGNGEAVFDLDLRGHGLQLARAAGWAGLEQPVTGRFSFAGGLRGALKELRGSWALGLADVDLLGQPLGSAAATVSLDDGVFRTRRLEFDSGLAGDLWWNVGEVAVGGELVWRRMPLAVLGDLAATAMADWADVRAELLWQRGQPLLGRLRADAKGARLEISSEPGQLRLEASIDATAVARATLERAPDGGLRGGGELWLESAADLLARLAPASSVPLTGNGRLRFEVEAPAEGGLVVAGRLETLEVELAERPVRLLEPARFRWDDHGLAVEGLWFAHHDDEIFLRWTIGSDGAVRGNMSGTLDGLLLRFLIPEWEPDGRVTGVVELLGTVASPRLEGIVEVADGSFRVPGTTAILGGIDGTALLSSDEAVLEGVGFRFMRGQARTSGRIILRQGRVELALDGELSGLEYPLFNGFVPRLAGSWRLTGPVDDLLLSGDLRVVRADLRRKDDLAAILFEWLLEEAPPPEEGGLRLDLSVESDRTLEAVNAFLNLEGSCALRLGGTTARPSVLGTVSFEEGGEFTLQGVRYELDRATLTFADPTGIEVLVDVQARTWVQSHQITLNLAGTPSRLVPTVASDPPLPQDDIFAMLAVGRRGAAAGGGLMGLGLASSLLTRELNQELERRTQLVLPVDQVRVDPFAEASTGNPAARITVVKQLDPRWTVMVQSNLSGNREEVVVSRWFLAPGIFVEATRDLDGSYALDLKVRRRY